MTDQARHERNILRLSECYAPFAVRVVRLIADLEREGFRPRIQQAFRTPKGQAAVLASGNSKVKWSFHMATTPEGKPDALAVDILDDDYPVPVKDQRLWPVSFRQYLLWLAALAAGYELETGLAWGLDAVERRALALAMSTDPLSYTKGIGWDPTHVEPRDLTLTAAKAGRRPWA